MLSLLFISLLIQSPDVNAQKAVDTDLRCKGIINPLWSNYYAIMDPTADAVIKNHPISEFAKKHPLINFDFPPGYLDDTPQFELGESNQSKQLKRVLEYIFPKATFLNSNASKRRLNVKISIYDSNEYKPRVKKSPKKNIIEMALLKQAIPLKPENTNALERERLQIDSDTPVASLYFDQIGPESKAAYQELEKQNFSVIFVSISPHLMRKNFAWTDWTSKNHFINLSEFLLLDRKPKNEGKWMVYNDMTGKMHQLYQASDLAFISGPNNLFEPLTVNTPLVYYDLKNGAQLHHY